MMSVFSKQTGSQKRRHFAARARVWVSEARAQRAGARLATKRVGFARCWVLHYALAWRRASETQIAERTHAPFHRGLFFLIPSLTDRGAAAAKGERAFCVLRFTFAQAVGCFDDAENWPRSTGLRTTSEPLHGGWWELAGKRQGLEA